MNFMSRKKISIIIFIFVLTVFALNISISGQDVASDWTDEDIGGDIPISGAVYFIIAALGIGAYHLFIRQRKLEKHQDSK